MLRNSPNYVSQVNLSKKKKKILIKVNKECPEREKNARERKIVYIYKL